MSNGYNGYAQLRSYVPALTKSLQPLVSLTSLTLSTTAAQQLGALRWAHTEAQRAVGPAGTGKRQPVDTQVGPLDHVYWVPDWLAAPGERSTCQPVPAW